MQEQSYKIITLGNYKVGKTELLSTFYTNKPYSEVFPSVIGIPYQIKKININDKIINIQLFDTFGEERYKNYINKQYYRNANGIFLCFDITNYKSFEDLDNWYNDYTNYLSKPYDCNNTNKSCKICEKKINSKNKFSEIILVGTKSDRQDIRQVSYNIALKYAKKKNIDYFEVSIFNIEEINNLFTFMINKIINKTHSNILDGEPLAKQEKNYCCIL